MWGCKSSGWELLPLSGSSGAARGAASSQTETLFRTTSPPAPSQNPNNPSAPLPAGGTQAAFVLGPSGDPLLVQQQCPFVRPARRTGTVNGRFCPCLFSLRTAEGGGEGEKEAGGEGGGSCSEPPRPRSPAAAPPAGSPHNGGLCGSGGALTGGPPAGAGVASARPREQAHSSGVGQPGGTGPGFVLAFGCAQ